MGNPLLDISSPVGDDWLKKYDLQPANAILADDKHQPIYEELGKLETVEYIPGGATLNSMRVAAWMLKGANKTAYSGCIGKDKYGDLLKSKAEAEGVTMAVQQLEDDTPTGTCAVLIVNKERSMVANLAAANKFDAKHTETDAFKAAVEASKIFYSAGFFLTVSVPAMLSVAEASAAKDGTYCLNLAAPFVIEFYKSKVEEVMPLCDIVFCNEDEAAKYAEVNDLKTEDLGEIAKAIQALPKKNDKKPRIAVITHGKEDTVVATSEGVKTYAVPPLEQEKIVDTNVAGDAFVGGFLAYLSQGADIEKCCQAGHYGSRVIIQQSGCTFPEGGPQFE